MKLLKEILGSFIGNFIIATIFFGAMYLLFANLRFDYAAFLFGLLILAVLIFIYWPRRR